MSLVVSARISRRCSVEEPVTVRPSPRAPERVLRGRRAAARSVPAWVVTSGPTGSDPTSSAPLPPAATSVGGPLDGTSGYSRNNNSRLRVGKRKRTIRQRASCTQSNESSRSSVYYSPHPNLRHARACRPARCCRRILVVNKARLWQAKIVIPETRPYTQLGRCHQIRCYCADGLRNGGDSGRAENSLHERDKIIDKLSMPKFHTGRDGQSGSDGCRQDHCGRLLQAGRADAAGGKA